MSSRRTYVIAASKPGCYRIDASCISPLVPIGNNLRSRIGIVVGGEDETSAAENDIDEETFDKEEISEENGWIPYQELYAPINRLPTTASTPGASQSSKYQAHIKLPSPSETHTFITPTPEEVLHYMLEGVEKFHSDVYGGLLHQSRDSGLDFQNLLRPEALRVLSSGNYSREK